MSVPSSDFGASFFDLAGPLAGPAAAAKTPPGPAHAAAAAPSAPAYGEAALTPFEWRLMQEPLSESLTRFPELRVTAKTDPRQVLNALLWIDNLLSAEQQQQVVGSKRKRLAAPQAAALPSSKRRPVIQARPAGRAPQRPVAAPRRGISPTGCIKKVPFVVIPVGVAVPSGSMTPPFLPQALPAHNVGGPEKPRSPSHSVEFWQQACPPLSLDDKVLPQGVFAGAKPVGQRTVTATALPSGGAVTRARSAPTVA